MRRLLCLLGYHRWEMFGRQHLYGRYYTRYDRCLVCRTMRVRGEERVK